LNPSVPYPLKRLALFAALFATAPAFAEDGLCQQLDTGIAVPTVEIDDRIIIDADQASLERNGISQLAGAVRLSQGGQEFTADMLDYDDATSQVRVRAPSKYRNSDLSISSQQATFDLLTRSGAFADTEYTLPIRSARGTSERIVVNADGTAELRNTEYTTCAPGDESWYIEAEEITLDHDEGLGTAHNATLRFKGLPILYLPYFQFPIDTRRRTGFLYPVLGQSDKTGFDYAWPIYVNLAPNYDATVTPRFMSRRGLQLGGQFRYLGERSEGSVTGQYLNHDQVYGDDRSLLTFDHLGLLSDRIGVQVDYSRVSDRTYFQDLGSSLATSSLTHLEQSATATYQAPAAFRIQTMVQKFQSIANPQNTDEKPYRRVPQVLVDALSSNSFFDTRAGINAEFVNFERDDSVQGIRSDLQPYLLFQHDELAWYVTSQADLHYTAYKLNDTPAGQTESPDRTLPVVSVESGLRFERLNGDGSIQTLEPRAFGLYVPYTNQGDLPLFDTGEPDFDIVQLFNRNRYYGADRISDAEHIAGALTTRHINPQTGVVQWSASVGQLYRFEAPRVSLPDAPAPEQGATDFIAEADYRLSARWRTVIGGQWSPKDDEFERGNLGFSYRDAQRGKQFDIAYRYRAETLEQTDVSFSWPIAGDWRLAARHTYSLRDDKSLDSLIGLEYQTCCYAIRASYREYVASNSGDTNTAIYLQLELKGLTQIGSGFSNLLPDEWTQNDWYE